VSFTGTLAVGSGGTGATNIGKLQLLATDSSGKRHLDFDAEPPIPPLRDFNNGSNLDSHMPQRRCSRRRAARQPTVLVVSGLNAASCDVKASTKRRTVLRTDASGGGGAWPFTPSTWSGVSHPSHLYLDGAQCWRGHLHQLDRQPRSGHAHSNLDAHAVGHYRQDAFHRLSREDLRHSNLNTDCNSSYHLLWDTRQPSWEARQEAFDCTSAAGLAKGCVTAADWLTFNGKLGTSTTLTQGNLLYSSGSNTVASVCHRHRVRYERHHRNSKSLRVGGALAIDCTVSTKSAAGCLAAADFNSFNVNRLATSSALTPGNVPLTGIGGGYGHALSDRTGQDNGVTVNRQPLMPVWRRCRG